MGFVVPLELQPTYQVFLDTKKKSDFAALCREDNT